MGEVTADVLNLRSGPGTNYEVVRTLQKGDLVTVFAKAPDGVWLSIMLPDGTRGWAHSDWVDLPVGLESILVTDQVPASPTP